MKQLLLLILLALMAILTDAQEYPKVILPGDYPDPSIMREGEDYYMTHSPFFYAPGFLIWHSKDLVNWEPVCRACPEYEGSAMAPDLLKYKDKYYIYYPTSKGENYVIHADNIRGPWSKPVKLDVRGIDPGHVVGEDGRRYLFTNNGWVAPLSDDGLKITGENKKVYDGWIYPKEWETEGDDMYLESPKLLFKDGYYFMTSAEGGTAGPATSHMCVMARSKSIFGPWENSPYNPVVHTYSATDNWWSKGHGTLIDDVNGNWWMIYHAYAKGYHTLGRQTLMEPMEYSPDGWFRPTQTTTSLPADPNIKHGLNLNDDFTETSLGMQWTFWKEYAPGQLSFKNNALRMNAKGSSPADGRLLLITPEDKCYETQVNVQVGKGNKAGLVLFYNEKAFAGVVSDGKNFTVYKNAEQTKVIPNKIGRSFKVKLLNQGNKVQMMVSKDGDAWTALAEDVDVSDMHHNKYKGFFALRAGLLSCGKGDAEFSQFRYRTSTINLERPRVIVTTDGEEDDRASMVRFLLSSNEFDVEGIINSSSEFHWVGGKDWNAFHSVDWVKEYIGYYNEVYANLLLHDKRYPSPEYLLSKWKVGNIDGIGEYNKRTEGAKFIVDILLDNSDPRPVWIQAWGGCNTLAAALKIIQEDSPERMPEVAAKMRLFLIWEQDQTYQEYIRPNWEHFNILTIISDQFDCMAYIWQKVLPEQIQTFFGRDWMTEHIIQGHGTLCDAYPNKKGAFNAEGDTPAFLHSIPNGLRSMENPGYGGWGGRYVWIRNNVWMDPAPTADYTHATGLWGFRNSWSKMMEHWTDFTKVAVRTNYFKPLWRWLIDIQNDFAARADWCIKDYASANHHPIVHLKSTPLNMNVKVGEKVTLDASGSKDPDGDKLSFHWWPYIEAGTYQGNLSVDSHKKKVAIIIPTDARLGDTIHIICAVSDNGTPSLTRYKRIIMTVVN